MLKFMKDNQLWNNIENCKNEWLEYKLPIITFILLQK